MKFFKDIGWWMPDAEEHLPAWMRRVNDRLDGRLLYQGKKYRAALAHVPPGRRRCAVDVGSHVGLWSWLMLKDFNSVVAFEPMPEHRRCYASNINMSRVALHGVALGDTTGTARVRTRTLNSSGDTGVEPEGARSMSARVLTNAEPDGAVVEMRCLDSYSLENVDFLKIDCEGYEVFVVRGAIETIKRCRPTIIVEQKPETGMEARYGIGTTEAVALLEKLGAKRKGVLQGDYILSFE